MNVYYRIREDYNIWVLPTVYFDGGYQLGIGADDVPSAEADFMARLDTCGMRPVPDVNLSLLVGWSGNATMYVQVSVQNNEDSLYEGHIRVYVTEITSSMGWNDTQGNPYNFTFLDYAMNEDIYINPGETWQESTIWDGNDHSDGLGHDFGSITADNVMVIAAVFNAEWRQGYSRPPDIKPFDAYYVDDAAAGPWVNFPPFEPADPSPEDEATGVEVDTDLSWTSGDPNENDTVTYDLYLGTSTPLPLVIGDLAIPFYDPETLLYETTYYWRIVTRDTHDTTTAGPVWTFTTKPEWIRGDCNGDEEIGLSDVVYLINYLFNDGPGPDPIESGNLNCDDVVGLADVVYLINYLFKNGSPPC